MPSTDRALALGATTHTKMDAIYEDLASGFVNSGLLAWCGTCLASQGAGGGGARPVWIVLQNMKELGCSSVVMCL